MREIALTADPSEPEKVSQRAFDAARRQSGITCPAAADVARSLRTPWRVLLEAIFDEDRDEVHLFSHRRRGKGNKYPADRKTCVSAVRLAAKRRGVDTLKPHEYEDERNKAISQARGGNRDLRVLRWPITMQVLQYGWSGILHDAGLREPEKTKGRNSGLPYIEALRIFLEHFGYLPREPPLRRAFVGRGLHLAVSPRNHTEEIEELRRLRAEAGLWTPSRRIIGTRDTIPEAPSEVEAAFDGEVTELKKEYISTPKGYWTLERVEDALDRALDRLPPGRSLTYRRFNEVSRGDPTLPYMSAIERVCRKNNTSFAQLRDAALRRRTHRS